MNKRSPHPETGCIDGFLPVSPIIRRPSVIPCPQCEMNKLIACTEDCFEGFNGHEHRPRGQEGSEMTTTHTPEYLETAVRALRQAGFVVMRPEHLSPNAGEEKGTCGHKALGGWFCAGPAGHTFNHHWDKMHWIENRLGQAQDAATPKLAEALRALTDWGEDRGTWAGQSLTYVLEQARQALTEAGYDA